MFIYIYIYIYLQIVRTMNQWWSKQILGREIDHFYFEVSIAALTYGIDNYYTYELIKLHFISHFLEHFVG